MITKNDKKEKWGQVNFRAPENYKTALDMLAVLTGFAKEEIGAEILGQFFGFKPMDEDRLKFIKMKMREANIIKICSEVKSWSERRDSNPRHSRWQRDALPG